MAIPFFGPFVAWAPPVIVAAVTKPDVLLPALAIMGVGWFVNQNILQPRVLAGAVGLHPVVVLASVLIGMKLFGIPGALFGLPVAAVISSFFFYFLRRTANPDERSVAARAARRLAERDGRPDAGAARAAARRGRGDRRRGRRGRPLAPARRRRRPPTRLPAARAGRPPAEG